MVWVVQLVQASDRVRCFSDQQSMHPPIKTIQRLHKARIRYKLFTRQTTREAFVLSATLTSPVSVCCDAFSLQIAALRRVSLFFGGLTSAARSKNELRLVCVIV